MELKPISLVLCFALLSGCAKRGETRDDPPIPPPPTSCEEGYICINVMGVASSEPQLKPILWTEGENYRVGVARLVGTDATGRDLFGIEAIGMFNSALRASSALRAIEQNLQ